MRERVMTRFHIGRWLVLGLALLVVSGSCGGKGRTPPKVAEPATGSLPAWVTHVELSNDKICGVGIAGAGFDEFSPYPKQLAQERAIRNVAGIFGTSVEEAIIDRQTNNTVGVEMARTLQIDDDLIEKIGELAEMEYWLDKGGDGPFAQKNFMYGHACVEAAKAASSLKIDPKVLAKQHKSNAVCPTEVPRWINRFGRRKDGRLCAVGFSMPMFHPDKSFDSVVEDVREQLATVIETLVSSYSEELATSRDTAVEMMTVATTQALAKGVVVTDYWYDRDGRGPHKQERSTYGWGCVYPMDILKQSVQAIEKKLPEQTVAKVRERAAHAFEDLDAEIAKRESKTAPAEKKAPGPI
jgi:uncharacterized protein YbjQ (UPF0145 family)